MACLISSSIEETQAIASELSATLSPGAILAFFGDLGAGKTTFIKSVISALSRVSEWEVCSPTFSYLNVYDKIYHFDLYRISSSEEFVKMGFEDYLGGDRICCIEWAERIEDILPRDTTRISIEHVKEGVRKIEIVRLQNVDLSCEVRCEL